jgi:hypothetical protein
MVQWLRVACSASLLIVAAPSFAVTGNEYRALSDYERAAWAMGVLEGIITTQVITTNEKSPIAACVSKFAPAQIRAILDKELAKSPELWHYPAAFTVWHSFHEICGLKGTK